MPDHEHHQDSTTSRQLIMATAGHVDHGKTSLIKHLTGVDTDTLKEERARGLTINPGYAYHHFNDPANSGDQVTLGFVDVPGHADFIPNMLAGVGSVAHALLVVACDDGVMPQTREHLSILQLLGIRQVVVALTKTDRASKEQLKETEIAVAQLLNTKNFENAKFFPIDNLSGEGTPELLNHLKEKAAHTVSLTTGEHRTRFLVDRSFSVKGIGTVVTGTLKQGQLRNAEQLVLSATGEEVRIRGLRLDDHAIQQLQASQRAAVNINVSHDKVQRGDWLQEKASYQPCFRIDTELAFLDEEVRLRSSTQYHLYIGATHHVVNIRALDEADSIYQVRSQQPMHAHYGDRFVIRDPAAKNTIGGGQVLDIFVPRKGRSSETRLIELKSKRNPAPEALVALLETSPFGVDCKQFSCNYDLTTAAFRSLVDRMGERTVTLTLKGSDSPRLLLKSHFADFNTQILKQIDSFHTANRSSPGISEPQLNSALDFQSSPLLLNAILELMIQQAVLSRTGTVLHLPNHQASLSQEEEQFLAKIHPILKNAGNIPPRTRELVDLTNIPLKPLERILKQCTKSGILIRVADNRHYLPETIAELAEFTEQLAESNDADSGFSVIQFRDASGIGRNLCIEILEYFDRIGFTRREDNARFIRTQKENIFG
ncbi:MAG: selenocysteine-specific translation elongation factor [Pseudomonadales bacterium]|nr:selenocysteine-specific translation elongation factor [Pseudomonadales bacterium]